MITGNEVTQALGSIGKAIDDDTSDLTTSSLMQKGKAIQTTKSILCIDSNKIYEILCIYAYRILVEYSNYSI
jgi:hypothetical protein